MRLTTVESNHWIEIDETTSLPVRVGWTTSEGEVSYATKVSLELELDGSERRAPTGGLEYYQTDRVHDISRVGDPHHVRDNERSSIRVPARIGNINADVIYSFSTHGPALVMSIDLHESKHLVRDLIFSFAINLPTAVGDKWFANIPGNGIRSYLPVDDLEMSTGISPLGGLRGSAALTHIQVGNRQSTEQSIAFWVDNDIEIPEITCDYKDKWFAWNIKTGFASDLSLVKVIRIPIHSMELGHLAWSEFPAKFDTWLRSRGISSPASPPEWVTSAMIFEAQIGFSVFARVNKYAPYPTPRDLINDLSRIHSLGFRCIQLMPRQPYPSYNVHDYWDIDISYGDKSEIRELVEKAHALGIRVILDVLLHGVLDKEIITIAADGVRNGPFADLLSSETNDSFSSDVKDWNNYLIAWSRHIIDFEEYWRDGSPNRTTLQDAHPDWFYRDSSGEVVGVYTKAFDARNMSWQQYFTDGMKYLVTELDIDGFRFDAPTYNDFHNWADWSRSRAGASALACTALFERMRPEFKAMKPDFLFYTEPSGLSLRRSMDLNYNYDEQWLVTALASSQSRSRWGIQNARDFARWIEDRDSLLPHGSMTAHHIDSHDTFWWPSWGKKWRREQFGIGMTRLLTIIFATLPGPFMMFIGGEEGIEDLLPVLSSLKSDPTWQDGEIRWWTDEKTPPELFGLSHRKGSEEIILLVNPSDVELKVAVAGSQFAELLKEGEVRINGSEVSLSKHSAIALKSLIR